MPTIVLKQHGGFKKANSFLERCLELGKLGFLDKYGRKGVEALIQNTPKDTGLAANSWSYDIVRDSTGTRIVWSNSDIEGGCNVAILVQYGHATKNGSWVEGRDFINPAIRPIFDEINAEISREVKAR